MSHSRERRAQGNERRVVRVAEQQQAALRGEYRSGGQSDDPPDELAQANHLVPGLLRTTARPRGDSGGACRHDAA